MLYDHRKVFIGCGVVSARTEPAIRMLDLVMEATSAVRISSGGDHRLECHYIYYSHFVCPCGTSLSRAVNLHLSGSESTQRVIRVH